MNEGDLLNTETSSLPKWNSLRKRMGIYLLFMGSFLGLTYFVIQSGEPLQAKGWGNIYTTSLAGSTKPIRFNAAPPIDFLHQTLDQFVSNIQHPVSIALLQIILIISIARVFSYIMRKMGQPAVLGEILAGIFLGPSLLGYLYQDAAHFIFPVESLKNLHSLSTIGLSLFMFIIGLDLDISIIKKRVQTALFVSHASIVVPFFFGVLLALFLYEDFAPANVSFLNFSLFLGISMSITAFPVLARIIQERGLSRTPLGIMAITCAATDDITAWCILAAVIAIAKAGSITSALFTIIISAIYVSGMIFIVKPWLEALFTRYVKNNFIPRRLVALCFILLMSSAYVAEVIGIHALFGAFLAGVIMPHHASYRERLIEKIEDVSMLLFLPIFFAFTGLRTKLSLLLDDGLWVTCLVVFVTAVAGKIISTTLSARYMGQTWRNSMALGALMNTRGLMELVVLNIGYDLGIISPPMFVMLVVMAIGTTFMTGPLLSALGFHNPQHKSIFDKSPVPDLSASEELSLNSSS